VIVFGYPPDRYSTTVSYFSSLGACTSPDPSTELSNCFRIGYPSVAEAMRAVRKNGEILGGSWMIGVKWAVSYSPDNAPNVIVNIAVRIWLKLKCC
jgi:nuclear pore complex protein Nup53